MISRHASSALIHHSEAILAIGVAVVGGPAIPGDPLNIILDDSLAINVQRAQVNLCAGIAGLRGLAKPVGRVGETLLYSPAIAIERSKIPCA